jgi:SNF2 family DNA or RNA helicase
MGLITAVPNLPLTCGDFSAPDRSFLKKMAFGVMALDEAHRSEP